MRAVVLIPRIGRLLAVASVTVMTVAGGVAVAQPAVAQTQWRSASAVDGDTIRIGSRTVRLLGYDTPERGQRCYAQAKARMAYLIRGGVRLRNVSGTDRYGRTLAYVQTRAGRDVGTAILKARLAIARYDSLDGYGNHPYQRLYRKLDANNGEVWCAAAKPTRKPRPPSGGSYASCADAKAAGAAPLYRGQPGYSTKLDRDRDGVACES